MEGTTRAGILLDGEEEEGKSLCLQEKRLFSPCSPKGFVLCCCCASYDTCLPLQVDRLACPLSVQFFLSSSLLFSSTSILPASQSEG